MQITIIIHSNNWADMNGRPCVRLREKNELISKRKMDTLSALFEGYGWLVIDKRSERDEQKVVYTD